jgi:hypothetical protein
MKNLSMPCAICKKTNEVRNDILRIKNIATRINRSVESATDNDISKRNKYLMKNQYLYSIFDYHKKCPYGIHCSKINSEINSFNLHSKKIVEDLVLLAIIDISEAKTYIREFGGRFPKAARFLSTFHI